MLGLIWPCYSLNWTTGLIIGSVLPVAGVGWSTGTLTARGPDDLQVDDPDRGTVLGKTPAEQGSFWWLRGWDSNPQPTD